MTCVCVAVAAYFLYTAGLDIVQSRQVSEEQERANLELERLQEKKAYLEAVREYAGSDAYVEQEARSKLGYVREGEVPFVVTSPPAPEDEVNGEWWERLFPR